MQALVWHQGPFSYLGSPFQPHLLPHSPMPSVSIHWPSHYFLNSMPFYYSLSQGLESWEPFRPLSAGPFFFFLTKTQPTCFFTMTPFPVIPGRVRCSLKLIETYITACAMYC